jgi:CheY-like chemotaxis protein
MVTEFPILVAEDNEDEIALLKLAFKKAEFNGPIHFVRDGHAAVDYLEGRNGYADRQQFPFPKVIVSDLKMPRVSGLELLQWLRNHPKCHIIPAILLSGSGLESDIEKAYKLGANTYFQKPGGFQAMVELLAKLKSYWAQGELPTVEGDCQ